MLVQVLINGLIASSAIAMMAVSFGLIYNGAKIFHFAHGAVFACGAYGAFLGKQVLGLPFAAAILIGMALSSLVGCVIEWAVYRPLRRTGASTIPFLLASLGVYILAQNAISLAFGDGVKMIRQSGVKEGIDLLGARITPVQLLIVCTSAATTCLVAVLLNRSQWGKAMRAISNDMELANASGINCEGYILLTFVIGSALAGLAGCLLALDVGMTPSMGLNALLLAVVAVIVGGKDSIAGAALGSLLLGLVQQFAVWIIGFQWQDVVAFTVLIFFLLFKPQGFLGHSLRKTAI